MGVDAGRKCLVQLRGVEVVGHVEVVGDVPCTSRPRTSRCSPSKPPRVQVLRLGPIPSGTVRCRRRPHTAGSDPVQTRKELPIPVAMTNIDTRRPSPDADRPVHQFARSVALTLVTAAPAGSLTLLDGRPFDTFGWGELAHALDDTTAELEHDVFYCQLGADARHEFDRRLDGEFLTAVLDTDRDLYIAAPDWESDEYDAFDPDVLCERLSPFGSNSLPALARTLAVENHMSGVLTVLLIEPAAARPYANILDRLDLVTDPHARSAARLATCGWLAEDLAAFATERPNARTIVVSDDRNIEWAALREHAGLVVADDHATAD